MLLEVYFNPTYFLNCASVLLTTTLQVKSKFTWSVSCCNYCNITDMTINDITRFIILSKNIKLLITVGTCIVSYFVTGCKVYIIAMV